MKSSKIILILIAVVLIVVIGVAILAALSGSGGKVAQKTILEVNLEADFLEYVPADPVAQLMLKNQPQVRNVVEALARAAGDERVAGLIANVGQGGMGPAQLQEIRQAILAFREAGKPAYAFSETFGEVSTGTGSYYLASAFDRIYLQQSGDVNLTGLILESPFVSGTLEKLGLVPRMDHRYEYKNAKNIFTETEYTEAHREVSEAIGASIMEAMVADLAAGRGMSGEEIRELMASGPFYGQEAVDAGLVDQLAYRDEAYDAIRETVGEGAELLYLGAYLKRAGRPHTKGETIALIYGVGNVIRGGEEYDPISGSINLTSEKVSAAFRAAIDDDDVKAIVFRIDSGGGSYVASDTIYRETLRAKEAGKPVIATMGNVAASGGYFVAMAADKIVAQPSTITGSIGVLGGKFLTEGMWSKLGLSWDHVKTSDNATMWSGLHDYSEEQWARFQFWLDRVYDDFTGKVAEGRGLPLETVREIAKGRVWTGAQAKERGLVDELGGLDVALRLAREAAGLDPDAEIRLRPFPKPKPAWKSFLGDRPSSSEATAVVARALAEIQPAVRMAQRLGLIDSSPRTLAMPPELEPQP
jgi:protease-4